tara:strand:+ start:67219 stop:67746 length:528 start_codon:yes stop_codon:yes gene_type:complete
VNNQEHIIQSHCNLRRTVFSIPTPFYGVVAVHWPDIVEVDRFSINQDQWWPKYGVVIDMVSRIEYITDSIRIKHLQEISRLLISDHTAWCFGPERRLCNPFGAFCIWCPNARLDIAREFKDSHEVVEYALFASSPLLSELNVATTPAFGSHDKLALKRIVILAPMLSDQSRNDYV